MPPHIHTHCKLGLNARLRDVRPVSPSVKPLPHEETDDHDYYYHKFLQPSTACTMQDINHLFSIFFTVHDMNNQPHLH